MLAELPIFIVAPLLLQPKSNAVSGRVQAMLFSQTAPDAPSMASCSFVVARMDRNPESMSAVSRTWDWRTSVRQAPLILPWRPGDDPLRLYDREPCIGQSGDAQVHGDRGILVGDLGNRHDEIQRIDRRIQLRHAVHLAGAQPQQVSPVSTWPTLPPPIAFSGPRPRLRRSSPGRSRWRRVPAASRRWYSTTVRWSPGWYRPRSSPFHPRRECPAH